MKKDPIHQKAIDLVKGGIEPLEAAKQVYTNHNYYENMLTSEILRLEIKNTLLRAALQDLYDEQNGAPLVRREKQWQAAMDAAEKLLKQ